jgi:hypothetical protein
MRFTTHLSIFITAFSVVAASAAAVAESSGPQVGDALPAFTIRGVLDDEAGKTMDIIKDSAGRPLIIFFIHERTRQSIALAREVLSDAANRKSDGLEVALVFLTADVAATEDWMKIATQALPRGIPIGISHDGPTGPPAYNLNPKVVVTVIIAKNNRVVANFGLTQPSVADDAPLITASIANVLE